MYFPFNLPRFSTWLYIATSVILHILLFLLCFYHTAFTNCHFITVPFSLNQYVVFAGCFVNFLGGLVIMSFASAAVNKDPIVEIVWWMLEDGRTFLVTMVVVGVLLILQSFVGVFGASSKDKPILLCFYLVSFLLVLLQLVYTGVIFEAFRPAELTLTYLPTFKEQWIKLATQSQGNVDSEDTQVALSFLNYTQSRGNCCGFDDATTQEQNPAGLACTSTDPCQNTFITEFRATVEKQTIFIFVFASIEAVFILLMCGLTVKRKQAPAFTKVKNGVGSMHVLKV
jgi:hypothetical protein